MLVTLIAIPLFLAIGLINGILAPLVSAFTTCGQPWGKKWQVFVLRSSKMSPDLKYLINQGAETVLAFECIKPCRRIGKIILIQYYKSGHSLGVIFVIWLLSLIKLILFYPLLEAVCCSKIRHEQITLLNDEIKKSKSKDNNGNELTSSNTTYDPDLNTNNRKISGNGVTNEYIAKERGAYDDNDDIWNDDNDASNKILMGLDSDGNGFTDVIDFGDDINTNNDDIKTDKKTKIGGAYDD